MTREGIVTKILQPFADRPGQRRNILKILRILIHHAIDIGWIKNDPSMGIKRPKEKEIRSWTEDEIDQFEARWPIGRHRALAFALILYTGQRRSDVHRMTWADSAGDAIRVIQQKTGQSLLIPLHAKCARSSPRRHARTPPSSPPPTGARLRSTDLGDLCARPSPLPACSRIAARTGSARRPVAAWRKQDARRMRSCRSLATNSSPRPNATRGRPIKRALQRPQFSNLRTNPRTSSPPNHP